jgi:hypothetical protein
VCEITNKNERLILNSLSLFSFFLNMLVVLVLEIKMGEKMKANEIMQETKVKI